MIYAASAALLLLASVGIWSWQRASSARVARQGLLPEIERLASDIPWSGEGPNGWTAYALAREAERSIPDDPMLNRLWAAISAPVTIKSDPPGARVLAKPYGQPDAKFPQSSSLTPRAYWLPSSFLMTNDDVRHACDSIRTFYEAGRSRRAAAA
jgi:dTDP-4-amino-4,6-dideoxygalactose transaminase